VDKVIWVWIEDQAGQPSEASLELLGEARRLADKRGQTVYAVRLGAELPAGDLAPHGADVELIGLSDRLKAFTVETALAATTAWAADHPPDLVLVAATPQGASLAPRLAARLGFDYAPRTVIAEPTPDGGLSLRQSVLGGKANALSAFPAGSGVVLTMIPGALGLDPPDPKRTGQRRVVEFGPDQVPAPVTQVGKFIPANPATVGLEEADRIMAGGLGFARDGNWALLEETAALLGAAVGGSKPTLDRGWIPPARLIGQSSGRRLAPRVFVGVGVSGSPHFVEGMKEARQIVAVNQDKGAPLVGLADLTLVGDLYEILPAVARQLRDRPRGQDSEETDD
jgi:electron transfer flavoprotein alpha subunit